VTEIRPLADTDWPAVLRIYGEGLATGNATFETEVPRRDVLEARWLPAHRWVAEIAGVVVGWAAASPVSTRSCFAGVAESAVYVAEHFHGRGIGRALVQRLVEAADLAGLWTLQTSIFPENIASLELHYAAGFRLVGVRERIARHNGVWRDTVLVERRRPD
jgi:L-amino acid N-acyltransferase YncA